MTESQVAAPTDSTSVLTANPVVILTFDDKSSAAVNQPSKTKSIEESIEVLIQSMKPIMDLSLLYHNRKPKFLIHSESILTTMLKQLMLR